MRSGKEGQVLQKPQFKTSTIEFIQALQMKRTESNIHRAPARWPQTQSIGKNLSSLLYGRRGQVEGELREVKWHAQGHSGLTNTSWWPERLEEAWERTLRRSLWRIHHHGIVMCIQERNVAHKGGNKNGWKGTEDNPESKTLTLGSTCTK